MYDILQFVHVVAAIVWIGAGTLFFVLLGRLSSAGDDRGIALLSDQAEWASKALFNPAAIVVLLSGIGMGLAADSFDWGAPWVSVGFAGIIVSLGIGHGIIRTTVKRLNVVVAEEGPQAPQADALTRRIAVFNAVDLLVLYVAVFAMVTQFSF